MIASTTHHANRASAASQLLDVEQVTGLLHSLLPPRTGSGLQAPGSGLQGKRLQPAACSPKPLQHDWPGPPGDVAIERCWPSADDGFIVEWSFSLGSDRRYVLYARSTDQSTGAAACAAGASNTCRPSVTAWGLLGMLSYLPERGLMVHSPDCDPAMPHLAGCLDEICAAELLAPFWESASAEPGADGGLPGVLCRLIGYKPGRRAAICYERKSSDGTGQRILGKTYHKRQAERLARLHYQVNDQFRKSSDGAIQVSNPVVYVPELQMALFQWAPGGTAEDRSSGPAGSITPAVRAMAALHGTTIEGLETFTVPDECAILQRWHRALAGAHPRMAAESAPLLAMLLQQSEAIDSWSRCTIHRDFYETQFVTFRGLTTLLDLDTLCVGHSCLDVGNFLAHLYLQLLRRGGGTEDFRHLVKETSKQYEGIAGRLDPEALDFYLNSSLFRMGAVHAFRTQTREFAEPIWQLARERLEPRAKGG